MKLAWIAAAPLAVALSQVASAYNTDAEVSEALAAFKKDYGAAKDDAGKVAAIDKLATIQHKQKIVDALAEKLLKGDSSEGVKIAAAKGLGGQWTLSAVPALAKGLNLDDPNARAITETVIQALGATDSDDAVKVLLTLVRAPEAKKQAKGGSAPPSMGGGGPPKQAQSEEAPNYSAGALQAIQKIASPKALDDLIKFIPDARASAQGAQFATMAQNACGSITGVQQPSADDYAKWWSANKSKVVQLYRCEGTGQKFEKADKNAKCPSDGDKNPKCGLTLKTKIAGGGAGGPAPPPPPK